MRLTAICNGLKRTISTSGRLGLLQMVSEPDTGRWLLMGVDFEIPNRLDRGTKHSLRGCFSCFKTVRLTSIRNGPKRTISTCSELGLLQ